MFKKLLWQLFALLFLVTGSTVSAEPIFRIVFPQRDLHLRGLDESVILRHTEATT